MIVTVETGNGDITEAETFTAARTRTSTRHCWGLARPGRGASCQEEGEKATEIARLIKKDRSVYNARCL